MPPTVQGVIAARLDLLPLEEKRFIQRAAVIGRTFGEEELAVVNRGGRPSGWWRTCHAATCWCRSAPAGASSTC